MDSTLTDAQGRFRFRFLADTSAIYLVSARHAGIVYFGPPVHTNPVLPDTAITLVVADTSSVAPISLEARHIVVSAPATDGTRSVVEVVLLHNGGPLTRVGRDSASAVWGEEIPHVAVGLTAGEGDLAPEAIGRLGDSVVVSAPISTGEKQIVMQYTIPAGVPRLDYHFGEPAALVNLMIEERGATVAGGLAQQADTERIEGRPFRRWEGRVPAGGTVTVRLPAPRRVGYWALVALVGAVLLGLALAAARAFAPGSARPRAAPRTADALLTALARLDVAHAGREAELSPEAWDGYRAERERLKAELTAALAARGSGT